MAFSFKSSIGPAAEETMGEINISEINIMRVEGREQLKAFVTMKIGNYLIIRDIKLINGRKGYFVAMPSKQLKNGRSVDLAYPLNTETRVKIERLIIEEYTKQLKTDEAKTSIEPLRLRSTTGATKTT